MVDQKINSGQVFPEHEGSFFGEEEISIGADSDFNRFSKRRKSALGVATGGAGEAVADRKKVLKIGGWGAFKW